jgi:predicted N-formylglutamate amidohydrolase
MERPLSHRFLITCEHASNQIPGTYKHLFSGADDDLTSHRGWDPGALHIAHTIKDTLHAPIFIYPFTRLLIEPNRSAHHPRLFSEFTKGLSQDEKAHIITEYYHPYRESVEAYIDSIISCNQPVIHLSIHTFAPVLNGELRDIDIGLLYDPNRPTEKKLCKRWKQILRNEMENLRIRMNRPYKGTSDGFTTTLRRRFGDAYTGIELEVNQQYFMDGREPWERLNKSLSKILLHIQE